MFLYAPRTEEQTDNLIAMYQTIIDEPSRGLFHLLFVGHYRFYFITQHKNKPWWQKLLKWAHTIEIDKMNTLGKTVMYTIIVGIFSYYGLCWLTYTFKVIVNYKRIRDEAPLNLLKLG